MCSFHLEILPEETKRAFFLVREISSIKEFYLAGGTAAALYLRHRLSEDLDFFTEKTFNESLVIQNLATLGDFQLEKKSEQTVIGILNNAKLSFIGYRYPLLSRPKVTSGIKVADIADIACMKIDTLASRGTKRDFIDVYFIARELISLPEILKLFQKKYTSLNYNMVHIKKSLVYFDDAEDEPMPKMIKPAKWKEVKLFFEKEVAKIS